VFQCVVLQFIAVLQYVIMCCVAVCWGELQLQPLPVLQCVVLQCVALCCVVVCCSVLQCFVLQ